MSDEALEAKMQSVQEYIPFLEDMMSELKAKGNRTARLEQLKTLHLIITESSRKMELETLNRYQEVLKNIFLKVNPQLLTKVTTGSTESPKNLADIEDPKTQTDTHPQPQNTTSSSNNPVVSSQIVDPNGQIIDQENVQKEMVEVEYESKTVREAVYQINKTNDSENAVPSRKSGENSKSVTKNPPTSHMKSSGKNFKSKSTKDGPNVLKEFDIFGNLFAGTTKGKNITEKGDRRSSIGSLDSDKKKHKQDDSRNKKSDAKAKDSNKHDKKKIHKEDNEANKDKQSTSEISNAFQTPLETEVNTDTENERSPSEMITLKTQSTPAIQSGSSQIIDLINSQSENKLVDKFLANENPKPEELPIELPNVDSAVSDCIQDPLDSNKNLDSTPKQQKVTALIPSLSEISLGTNQNTETIQVRSELTSESQILSQHNLRTQPTVFHTPPSPILPSSYLTPPPIPRIISPNPELLGRSFMQQTSGILTHPLANFSHVNMNLGTPRSDFTTPRADFAIPRPDYGSVMTPRPDFDTPPANNNGASQCNGKNQFDSFAFENRMHSLNQRSDNNNYMVSGHFMQQLGNMNPYDLAQTALIQQQALSVNNSYTSYQASQGFYPQRNQMQINTNYKRPNNYFCEEYPLYQERYQWPGRSSEKERRPQRPQGPTIYREYREIRYERAQEQNSIKDPRLKPRETKDEDETETDIRDSRLSRGRERFRSRDRSSSEEKVKSRDPRVNAKIKDNRLDSKYEQKKKDDDEVFGSSLNSLYDDEEGRNGPGYGLQNFQIPNKSRKADIINDQKNTEETRTSCETRTSMNSSTGTTERSSSASDTHNDGSDKQSNSSQKLSRNSGGCKKRISSKSDKSETNDNLDILDEADFSHVSTMDITVEYDDKDANVKDSTNELNESRTVSYNNKSEENNNISESKLVQECIKIAAKKQEIVKCSSSKDISELHSSQATLSGERIEENNSATSTEISLAKPISSDTPNTQDESFRMCSLSESFLGTLNSQQIQRVGSVLSKEQSNKENISGPNKAKKGQQIISSIVTERDNDVENKDLPISIRNTDETQVNEVTESLEHLEKEQCNEGHLDSEPIVVSIGGRIKNRRRASQVAAARKRKSELDLLNADIQNMFINEGVLKATGKRRCAQKDDPIVLLNPEQQSILDESERIKTRGPKRKVACNSSEMTTLKQIKIIMKKIPDDVVSVRLASVPSETPSLSNSDLNDIPVVPDIDYYYDYTTKSKLNCKLCQYSGHRMTVHYLREHPGSEVLTSRLSPHAAAEAIEDYALNKETFKNVAYKELSNRKFQYSCRFCGYVGFFSPQYFYDHVTMHTGEYRHRCEFCECITANFLSMSKHYRNFHPDEEKSERTAPKQFDFAIVFAYMCSECNFVQLEKKSLQGHIKVYHFGAKSTIHKINISKILDLPLKNAKSSDSTKKGSTEVLPTKNSTTPVRKSAALIKPRSKSKEAIASPLKHSQEDVVAPVRKRRRSLDNLINKDSKDDLDTIINLSSRSNRAAKEKATAKLKLFIESDESDSEKESSDQESTESDQESDEEQTNVERNRTSVENHIEEVKRVRTISSTNTNEIAPPVENKSRESDLDVFMCDILPEQANTIEEDELRQMDEVNKLFLEKPELAFIRKLSNRPNSAQELEAITIKKDLPDTTEHQQMPLLEKLVPVSSTETPPFVKLPQNKVQNLLFNSIQKLQEKIKETVQEDLLKRNENLEFSVQDKTSNDELIPEIRESIISLGDLIRATRTDSGILYSCHVNECNFTSKDKIIFKIHCKLGIHEHIQATSSLCDRCGVLVKITQGKKLLENLYEHLVNAHGNFISPMSPVGVGNDKLLLIKKGKESKTEDSKEQKSKEIVLLQDIQAENDASVLLASKSNTPSFSISDTCPPLQIVNDSVVTSLIKEGPAATAAMIEPTDDTSHDFKIVEVTSLAESDHIEPVAAVINTSHDFKIVDVTSLANTSHDFEIVDVTSLAESDHIEPVTAVINTSHDFKIVDVTSLANTSHDFEIVDVTSLAESDHIEPVTAAITKLPPLVLASQEESPPQSKVIREAKLTSLEASQPRKEAQALQSLIETPGNLYKCPHFSCKFSSNVRTVFASHLKEHTSENTTMVPCVYCDVKTPWDHVSTHIDIRHAASRHTCRYCLYRAVAAEYVCLHLEQCHPNQAFVVISVPPHKAAKKFSAANIKIDYKQLCEPYRCVCTNEDGNLKSHEYLFGNEFVKHLNIHKQDSVQCGYPRCFQKLDPSAMLNHWALVHKVGIYQCSNCKVNSEDIYRMYSHFAEVHPNMMPNILVRKNESSLPKHKEVGYADEAYRYLGYIRKFPPTLLSIIIKRSQCKEIRIIESDSSDTSEESTMALTPPITSPSNTLFSPISQKNSQSVLSNPNLPISAASTTTNDEVSLLSNNSRVSQSKIPLGTSTASLGQTSTASAASISKHPGPTGKVLLQTSTISPNEFMFIPRKETEVATHHTPELSVVSVTYKPDEIDSIPDRQIFNTNLKCGECNYQTKVRINIKRHLQMHLNEEVVPDTAPVNPAPCLEKNKKLFDKMWNLAASSFPTGRMGGSPVVKKKDQNKDKYPEFVPSHRRFVCSAQGCSYLCPKENNLKQHIMDFHKNEANFTCAHCKVAIDSSDVKNVITHIKLHGLYLYKCKYCSFVHYLKHKVQKHILDGHSNFAVEVVPVRCMELEPEFTSPLQSVALTTKFKSWSCCLCIAKYYTKDEILTHILKKHNIDAQYKCSWCAFKDDQENVCREHYEEKHPDNEFDIILVYRETEEEPLEDTSITPFDTTPLWQRDKPRVHHIRGILFDKNSPKKKFSILKTSPVASTSSAKKMPSSVFTKRWISDKNVDDSIDVVARGIAETDQGKPGSSGISIAKTISRPVVDDNASTSNNSFVVSTENTQKRSAGHFITKTPPITLELKNKSGQKPSISSEVSSSQPVNIDKCFSNPTNPDETLKLDKVINNAPEKKITITTTNQDARIDSDEFDDVIIAVMYSDKSNVLQESRALESNKTQDSNLDVSSTGRGQKRSGATEQEVVKMPRIEETDDASIANRCSRENLISMFGAIGKPLNKQLKCPKCGTFRSKKAAEFIFHLYEEFHYHRYQCRDCGFLCLTYKFLLGCHIQKHHPNATVNLIKPLPPYVELETWIQMVIREQSKEILESSP
ncbi:unnamed protein product [Ceutorhynchus assimilis]|uniref:C2H2-type domain-containing protein n=1 Tax=Ceutorhynchus assimilis TaxID=467358 RepID=A0A9N9MXW2_9CUCU|nr:unnamed protein product [Ceutorhynchus assimilis]